MQGLPLSRMRFRKIIRRLGQDRDLDRNKFMAELSHFDNSGKAIMVDVSEKDDTSRQATASGVISMNEDAWLAVTGKASKKGDVLAVARIAGIMAVKRTWELIPLCHPLQLGSVTVDFELDENARSVKCLCTAKTFGKTGVEMEALTGVNIALLTVYDMCKAVDRSMRMTDIMLEEKLGGKSGHYKRK